MNGNSFGQDSRGMRNFYYDFRNNTIYNKVKSNTDSISIPIFPKNIDFDYYSIFYRDKIVLYNSDNVKSDSLSNTGYFVIPNFINDSTHFFSVNYYKNKKTFYTEKWNIRLCSDIIELKNIKNSKVITLNDTINPIILINNGRLSTVVISLDNKKFKFTLNPKEIFILPKIFQKRVFNLKDKEFTIFL